MEVFSAYLTHSLDLLNGVTAFSVLQALTFVYWSQTDDFKDTVRFGGHSAALAGIVMFMLLYWAALWVINHDQINLIDQLSGEDIKTKTNLTAEYLKREASRSMWQRMIVVCVFHVLCRLVTALFFEEVHSTERPFGCSMISPVRQRLLVGLYWRSVSPV
jgi:hypothetical protein